MRKSNKNKQTFISDGKAAVYTGEYQWTDNTTGGGGKGQSLHSFGQISCFGGGGYVSSPIFFPTLSDKYVVLKLF